MMKVMVVMLMELLVVSLYLLVLFSDSYTLQSILPSMVIVMMLSII